MQRRRFNLHLNRRALRRWHRHGGKVAALFVVILAGTGLLLNHSAELGLASRHVEFTPLLSWYGLDGEIETLSFDLGDSWVSCVGGQTFLDRQPLVMVGGCPIGAVRAVAGVGMRVVATPSELVLVSEEGELIERLDAAAGLPVDLLAVGVQPDGTVVVEAPSGWWGADRELLRWTPLPQTTPVNWSRPAAAPAELRADLLRAYRGEGLSVERLVQDLHSGRLFGRWGAYLVDGVAVLLLLLVASGLLLGRQGRREGRLRLRP